MSQLKREREREREREDDVDERELRGYRSLRWETTKRVESKNHRAVWDERELEKKVKIIININEKWLFK